MFETLREFIDEHIENYNGVRLYITSSDVSDEFTIEDLESNEWSYLKDKTIENWSFGFGTFHIDLRD